MDLDRGRLTLIVVRIGDEAGADAEQREGLDLHVRRADVDVGLIDGDVAVVLLVDVQVLDQTVLQKVLEGAVALHQLLDVLVRHLQSVVHSFSNSVPRWNLSRCSFNIRRFIAIDAGDNVVARAHIFLETREFLSPQNILLLSRSDRTVVQTKP